MRRELAVLVVAGLSAGTARAAAQATGTTTFNAPYRAFVRSEIGVPATPSCCSAPRRGSASSRTRSTSRWMVR